MLLIDSRLSEVEFGRALLLGCVRGVRAIHPHIVQELIVYHPMTL